MSTYYRYFSLVVCAICLLAFNKLSAQNLEEDVLEQANQIGRVYESYLSPHQEPGEEKDTPKTVPKVFQSTKPSKLRSERDSRGYGRLSFSKDLSKVFVEVKIEGVDIDEINMFHLHCGKPDQLGPILVDFSLGTEIQLNFKDDGIFAIEITNKDIVAALEAGHGLVGGFTAGCPIAPGLPGKVKTVAGMEYIAEKGELYFNLHTEGQTFYGDIRGRILPASSVKQAEVYPSMETPPPPPSSEGGHNH
ncbi:MAG: CHRD domain-containing protein [Bacteroidota bacterium]